MLDLDLYDWPFGVLNWFGEEIETEEVKRKKKELQEAWKRAREQWREKHEEKRALVPTFPFPPGFLRMNEEEFRGAIERYARGHPEEKISGTAFDLDNFVYRAVQIRRERAKED